MRIDDRLIGGALALLSMAIILGARGLPSVPGTTFGPELMPTLIGTAMGVLSIRIFVTGLLQNGATGWVDISEWKGAKRPVYCAIWTIAGIALGIALLPIIGFPLYGLGFALPLMLLMGARAVSAVLTSVCLVLVAQFVFARLLFVPLPAGPLPLPW
uniref:tripartite tricarboxylate transporter TctB family protein n=1 Tax=Pararhizobium sp. IMCC3301 TaxID=3067904 RepID=UPI002741B0ED|nr:tripartite tricarboxylate transporter TctB family protein [Pararhizobium sp. IMCC3301]